MLAAQPVFAAFQHGLEKAPLPRTADAAGKQAEWVRLLSEVHSEVQLIGGTATFLVYPLSQLSQTAIQRQRASEQPVHMPAPARGHPSALAVALTGELVVGSAIRTGVRFEQLVA